MTQEKKQLLLKDLCARLPYGVKGLAYIVGDPCLTNTNIVGIINESIVTDYESPMLDLIDFNSKDIIIKPYLRPMSSMTKDEEEYVKNRWCYEDWDDIYDFLNHYQIDAGDAFDFVDWLNAHHFDYRGLIEKGLALEAPEGMYNTKTK